MDGGRDWVAQFVILARSRLRYGTRRVVLTEARRISLLESMVTHLIFLLFWDTRLVWKMSREKSSWDNVMQVILQSQNLSLDVGFHSILNATI